ncbi:DUF6515 family protein [Flavihumibacter profundi]|uniref:DUF6515 family protein n=1 Tax=Flavihumibacter profundi TaxID=2716883 RepID=UPI001CC4C7D5|nr:DUF6515 family protein [Flavihumibacter profundi]MBZ5856223.1 DUF6515 family protein [Flavihumibacter profundi]
MKTAIIMKVNPLRYVLGLGLIFMFAGLQLSAQRPRGGGGARPATASKPVAGTRPSTGTANRPATGNKPGNRTNNVGSNNKNVNININHSTNVRVNNSRNTVVRRNTRPYVRPPFVYGGRRFMCYHPYHFHPFHPFVWGPMWHPWGFFIAALATTAIIVSFADNDMPPDINLAWNADLGNGHNISEAALALSGPYDITLMDFQENYYYTPKNSALNLADEYYYDQGVFYLKGDDGYTVVSAPIGAIIKTLPSGYETITLDDNTKNYYYGGTFYEKNSKGYKVVAPLAGSVVEHVSEGGEEVKMGDVTYIKLGETYFQPIEENGKDMYEVADVEEDKK